MIRIGIVVILTFMLSGCGLLNKTLEEQGISTVLGYDLLDNNKIKGTVALLQFNPNKSQTQYIISETGKNSKEIGQKLEKKTNHDITSGQLRTIMFQDRLAQERGIKNLLDTIQRDNAIGSLVYVAIVNGSVEELVNKSEYEDASDIGTYIYNMFEKQVDKEMLNNINIHDFISLYYEVGVDPTLPVLKLDKTPVVQSVAIFNVDKMVGTISTQENLYIKLSKGKKVFGYKTISIPVEELREEEISIEDGLESIEISFKPTYSKSDYKIISKDHVVLGLQVSIEINEVSSTIDFNSENTKKVEKLISKKMNKEFKSIISKLQEMKSDPLGFGRKIKSLRQYSKLEDNEWYDIYPKVLIETNVSVKIKRTGVIN